MIMEEMYLSLRSNVRNIDWEKVGQELVLYQHRTEQQNVMRNLVALLHGASAAMLQMEGDDARNENSKEWAKEFEAWYDENLPYFPYI